MKVSISCLVYNHEPFIRQTIESILAQKVNFDYEILIHDDASTDNSQNIIREYAAVSYTHLTLPTKLEV